MRDYIDINLVAAYMTDANGVPTPIDMLDWQGISLLSGQAPNLPNTFAANQWSVASGSGPREVIITVSVLPANGGSPLSGIQYRFGNGAWATLTGVNTGPRTVLASAAGESYEVSLRAMNASGPSGPSAGKTVTSGAPAATVPAQIAANQWAVNTGDNPAEVVLDITALPSNGGSVLTALQYKVGTGAWTALAGVGTGQRTLIMSEPGSSYSIAVRAVNAVGAGPESAAKTVTSAGAALSAPSVSSATIDGTIEQSGTLTANIVMAGNPAPSVESIQWKKNGTNINGATSPIWTKTGLTAGDVISYAYVVANGVLPKATGNASNPITITALPTLMAPTSSITQGEQAIVSFNTLPDSVTITQSGAILTATRIGSTNSYNFTPLTADPVAISATKAGYSPYNATWTVQPAPASLSIAPQNIFRVDLTEPETMTFSAPSRYAGDYVIDPAASGPRILGDVVLRTVSGNAPAVGEEVIVDVGPVDSAHTTGLTLDISVFAGAEERTITGNRYTPVAADAGKDLTAKVIAIDASGTSAEIASNSLAIPAAGLQIGVTPIGFFTAARTNAAVRTINIDLGPADSQKVIWAACTFLPDFSPVFAVVANGVEYPISQVVAGIASGTQAAGIFSASVPAGGAAVLRITHTVALHYNPACYIWATKGMTRLTNPANPADAMTAGTAQSWTVNTQPNDVFLAVAAAAMNSSGGLFTPSATLTELADAQLSVGNAPSQFAAYMGTETDATTGRVFSLTPSQTGNVTKRAIHLRRS